MLALERKFLSKKGGYLPSTSRPRRTKKLKPATSQSREEFLAARVDSLESDLAASRAKSSWIAVLNLGRDLDKAHAELISLRASQGDQNRLDPAALVDGIEQAIRDEADGLPEDDVERLYIAACERLGFTPDGGPGGQA